MKKVISLVMVLLMVFIFVGCNNDEPIEQTDPQETTAVSEVSKKDNIPFEDDQLYAVAFMGNLKMDPIDGYANYLDTTDLPVYEISEGDFYLVIPRYDNMNLKLSKIDVNTEKRTVVKEVQNSGAFIVQCNVSDIIQDAVIELTYEDEKVEFTPFISLKDGGLEIGDRGLNITLEK